MPDFGNRTMPFPPIPSPDVVNVENVVSGVNWQREADDRGRCEGEDDHERMS